MKVFIVILTALIFTSHLNGQAEILKTSTIDKIKKNSIYFEVMGNGYFYSLNYDRIIPLRENKLLLLRLGGLMIPPDEGTNYRLLLLGETGILIGGPVHYADLGIGFTSLFRSNIDRLVPIRLGYRYQGRKGLVIRAAPMYIISRRSYINFWAGLSIGFSF